MSGEGAELFLEGTNVQGVDTCRRAPTAYAALLALEPRDDVADRVLFLACSGAKIEEIAAQLARVPGGLGSSERVEMVLLSVGGNDALFGTVGRVCLLPFDCTEFGRAWLGNLPTLVPQLQAVYRTVLDAFPGADVYVVPYPSPINRSRAGCDYSMFSGDEHAFLAAFTAALDDTVAGAVSGLDEHRLHFVDTMPAALAGSRLRLCDTPDAGDAGVNLLAANSVLGSLEQSVFPLNWVHNSLHPNARGHEAMRAAFLAFLDGVEPAPLDVPEPDLDGTTCQDLTGKELEACSWDWAGREAAGFLLRKGWMLVLTRTFQ